MAKNILDLYKDQAADLQIDQISETVGKKRQTPYSVDDSGNPDESVLNDDFLAQGRKGEINSTPYSSGVKYNPS
jgi:hypothetical protein